MNPLSTLSGPPHEIAAALRQKLGRLERRRLPAGSVLSGCAELDRLLPGGGFARGTLVEWLAESETSGAGTLALLAARQAAATGGAVVVFDENAPHESFNRDAQRNAGMSASPRVPLRVAVKRRERQGGNFYPPAAAALGIDLQRLIVVRAASERDELWALYQTLRSPGVAAVWAPLEQLEWRWFRRLQLAAETGGGVGHLLRPASVRGRPTWSQLQLLVEPLQGGEAAGRRLRVELVRCRTTAGGIAPGGVVELELQSGKSAECPGDETPPFVLAAEPARPAKCRGGNKRAAG